MNREELIDFLRENLNIEVSIDESYECGSEYITCNVILRLGDEIISDSYDSVNVS